MVSAWPAPALGALPRVDHVCRIISQAATAMAAAEAKGGPTVLSATPVAGEKKFEFYAGMTCGGCSGAITRILSKTEGVRVIDCDIEAKRLLVTGTATSDAIGGALAKWSTAAKKEVRFVKEVTDAPAAVAAA